jgi:hypothetical protein
MRNFFEPTASPAWLRQVLSSIRAALGDIWPAPLRLKDYATADLPAAADFAQGLVWDATALRPSVSNGAAWIGLQPWDATLAALAGLDAAAGILVETAAATFAKRSLAAPAAGLTIANPAGIAGNPTFELANDLAALEALSGTSTIYYRSGVDTWSAVTIGGLLSFAAGTLNIGSTTGTGTNVVLSAGPSLSGTVTIAGSVTVTGASGDLTIVSRGAGVNWSMYDALGIFYWYNPIDGNAASMSQGGNFAVTGTISASSLTASQLVATNGSKILQSLATATYPSLAELAFVKGVTSAIQAQVDGKQPLDADLTALAALTGTNNIYYRSAANTWTAVTVGGNLGFSAGTLGSSLGTMATQAASAVAIAGGTLASLTSCYVGATGDPLALGAKFAVTGGAGTGGTFMTTASASEAAAFYNSATAGDNLLLRFFTDGGAGRGSITYNRAGGLTAYNTTSDYRAKDDLGPLSESYVDAVLGELRPFMGRMHGTAMKRPMLIAHEVAEAGAPYAVTGEKDAVNDDGPVFQQLDVSALVPLLLAKIQMMDARQKGRRLI